MNRSRLFLLTGALLLGFFLVGAVFAVRLVSVASIAARIPGEMTLDVTVPGTGASHVVGEPGTSRPLVLGTASRLEVSGAWKVVLVPGAEGQATVTFPPSSHLRLKIRNDGTTLALETNGSGQGMPVLEVSLSKLREVTTSGASVLDLGVLSVDRFVLSTSGASTLSGSGRVRSLEIHSSGSSQVDFGRVSTSEVWVESSGAGNLVLRCDGPVTGQASGAVNLNVLGNPVLRLTTNGSVNVTNGGP
jgi:hypothetical protein